MPKYKFGRSTKPLGRATRKPSRPRAKTVMHEQTAWYAERTR